MVSTRGKKKTESLNMNLDDDKTAENTSAEMQASDSLKEESKPDAQFIRNVEIQGAEARNNDYEEKSDEAKSEKRATEVDNCDETTMVRKVNNDGGKTMMTEVDSNDEKTIVTEVENNDEKLIVAELNGNHEAEVEEHNYDDDEIDDQENVMWRYDEESSEDENEEDFIDEDEGSEEAEAEEEAATEEDTQEVKEMSKRDGKGAEAKDREAGKHNIEKVEVSLKNMKKPSLRNRKKVGTERLKKVDVGDKPETSRKRKAKKRVESMGMIFMCSSKTKNDCYKYRVLGLPESKKDTVEKIYKGMRLFLYDVDLKLMYGIYKAVGPGGYNIEPKAFKSQFPSQVRFTVLDDCLPLAEEKFKKIIKDNYYTKTKFDCLLNSEQVKKLCKLFASSSKQQETKKIGRTCKVVEKCSIRPIRLGRTRRQRDSDNKRCLPLREDHRNHERPHKRQRKIPSEVPALRQHLPPPNVRSFAYERTSDVDAYRQDPYLETHSSYRDNRRDPPLTRRGDAHKDGRDTHYRYGHDTHPEHAQDPDIERHNPYRDRRDTYLQRHDPYRDGRVMHLERRDLYKDGQDSYLDLRNPYRDGRDTYLERRDLYRDSYLEVRGSEPYGSSSRRLEPLPDRRDVYRDSYRRDELLERREINPISLGMGNRNDDVGSRDSYLSYRERPLHAGPIYSDDYHSRAGLARQYRL